MSYAKNSPGRESLCPTIEGVVIRRARKAWTCVECAGAINRGDDYVEYLGEAPAYASGTRYCDGCAIDAGLAVWINTSDDRDRDE